MEVVDIRERIKNLVNEEYSKMTFSKKYSNRARLSNICEDIIYNQWGISSNEMWEIVDEYVEELISDEED